MVELKWNRALFGYFTVFFSITSISEGLPFAFSAESFCAAQADGWAFFQSL